MRITSNQQVLILFNQLLQNNFGEFNSSKVLDYLINDNRKKPAVLFCSYFTFIRYDFYQVYLANVFLFCYAEVNLKVRGL